MLAGTWPGAGCPGGAEAAGNPGEHTVEVTRMVPETAPVKVTVVVGTDGVGCELTCAAGPGAFGPWGAAGPGVTRPKCAAKPTTAAAMAKATTSAPVANVANKRRVARSLNPFIVMSSNVAVSGCCEMWA